MLQLTTTTNEWQPQLHMNSSHVNSPATKGGSGVFLVVCELT